VEHMIEAGLDCHKVNSGGDSSQINWSCHTVARLLVGSEYNLNRQPLQQPTAIMSSDTNIQYLVAIESTAIKAATGMEIN
jgi:hypothetical protein